MEFPPDDPAGREKWLERWVIEQAKQGRLPGHEPRMPVAAKLRWRARMKWLKAQTRFAFRAQALGDRLFDREHATSHYAHLPEHEHPDRISYVPSPWHVLPRALRHLGVSRNDTFVDFGCGKGRVVDQAAKPPFRSVIGVEISASLAETARAE